MNLNLFPEPASKVYEPRPLINPVLTWSLRRIYEPEWMVCTYVEDSPVR